MHINIEITESIEKIIQSVNAKKSIVELATMRALKKTALWIKSQAAREISEEKRIYSANNVAKNIKLEKSISRKLLCPKTREPFIYSANNRLTISFNE